MACGCAGCYTAHAALELYAEAFDAAGALDRQAVRPELVVVVLAPALHGAVIDQRAEVAVPAADLRDTGKPRHFDWRRMRQRVGGQASDLAIEVVAPAVDFAARKQCARRIHLSGNTDHA